MPYRPHWEGTATYRPHWEVALRVKTLSQRRVSRSRKQRDATEYKATGKNPRRVRGRRGRENNSRYSVSLHTTPAHRRLTPAVVHTRSNAQGLADISVRRSRATENKAQRVATSRRCHHGPEALLPLLRSDRYMHAGFTSRSAEPLFHIGRNGKERKG